MDIIIAADLAARLPAPLNVKHTKKFQFKLNKKIFALL